MHVARGKGEARFWVTPKVALARSSGFDARTLGRLEGIVGERQDKIRMAWHAHFG